MLTIQIDSASDINALKKADNADKLMDSLCILKFRGIELARSVLAIGTNNPFYALKETIRIDQLRAKEKINCRPFYMEHLDLDLVEVDSKLFGNGKLIKGGFNNISGANGAGGDQTMEKIGECRIPLNFHGKQTLKIVKLKRSDEHSDLSSFAILKVTLIYDTATALIDRPELSSIFPPSFPQYQQLFLNFRDTSPSSVIGLTNLPGPTIGERVLDKHTEVVWYVTTHTNAFGDVNSCSVTGVLVVTDLRLVFIPHSFASSANGAFTNNPSLNIDGGSADVYNDGDINTLRRLTIQIPIPTIDDITCVPSDNSDGSTSSNLNINLKDGSEFTFLVQKSSYAAKSKRAPYMSTVPVVNMKGEVVVKLKRNTTYISGLETDELSPWVWSTRVVDCVNWMLREDLVWVRWLKALRQSVSKELPQIEMNEWSKESEKYDSWESDFIRQRVQDANWVMSDVNSSYEVCPTYPQTLVVPGLLSDDEIRDAASERSKGRACALVWIHPENKASLTRSAQPHTGMKDGKADRKTIIAIKSSAMNGLPVRIADARPKINANANALQGKGYENIQYLGGASNASIIFLDIENIHVVRSSYTKLKSGLLNNSTADDDSVNKSQWLLHISLILKGSVAVAESLIIGHPVLVHCSDGWDRTAQLTSIAQILLDPYYRTIKGLLILLNKEFCAFGHQFEMRLGSYTSKESSQILMQYLDAVWQIVNQNPVEFEYSPYMLQVILQSAYSGLFSSFRGNCDRERNKLLRSVRTSFELTHGDAVFSSIFVYINILLRSPIHNSLLVNPFYKNSPSKAPISYFRPRFGVNDLQLWRAVMLMFTPDFSYFLNGSSNALTHERLAMAMVQLSSNFLTSNSSSSNGAVYYDKLVSKDNIFPYNSIQSANYITKNGRSSSTFSNAKAAVKWLYADSDNNIHYAVTVLGIYFKALKNRKDLLSKLAAAKGGDSNLKTIDSSRSSDGHAISNDYSIDFNAIQSNPSQLKALKRFLLLLSFRKMLFNFYLSKVNGKVIYDNCKSIVQEVVEEAAAQGALRGKCQVAVVDASFVYNATLTQLSDSILAPNDRRLARKLTVTSGEFSPKEEVIGFDSIYGSPSSSSSGKELTSQQSSSALDSLSNSMGSLFKGLGFGSK